MRGEAVERELENRFRQRTIQESHLAEHDRERPPERVELPQLTCSPDLPEGVQEHLRRLLSDLLQFAAQQGFRLRQRDDRVRISTPEAYFHEQGRPVPTKLKLPAVQLRSSPQQNVYTLLLPLVMKSSEPLLEGVRLLIARLLGERFLEESVWPLEFYRDSGLATESDVRVGVEEQLALVAVLEFPSPTFASLLPEPPPRKKVPDWVGSQRKQHLQAWHRQFQEDALPDSSREALEHIFSEFLSAFRHDREAFLQQAGAAIWRLNAQAHFLLPHEIPDFQLLEQQRPEHFLRSVGIRLEERLALAEFVLEAKTFFEAGPEDSLDEWRSAFRLKSQELLRTESVGLLFIPDALASAERQTEEQRWQLRLIKLAKEQQVPGKQWRKWMPKARKAYEQGIAQKLLEALHRLSQLAQQPPQEGGVRLPELEKLGHSLRYRIPQLRELRSALGAVVEVSEGLGDVQQGQRFSREAFGKAWSYVLSVALILDYHEAHPQQKIVGNQRFNSKRYRKWVLQEAERRARLSVNHFHEVLLLLQTLYPQTDPSPEHGLPLLRRLTLQPLPILRFLLHRIQGPLAENPKYGLEYRLKKLENYAHALSRAYANRLQEEIPP